MLLLRPSDCQIVYISSFVFTLFSLYVFYGVEGWWRVGGGSVMSIKN